MPMTISLCMIVKDESKYIKQCLESALPVIDEAIVVDTGSKDGTIDIVKQYFGERVKLVSHKWNNDFSEARNVALKQAKGDWILVLDGDEKLNCEVSKLKELLSKDLNEAYYLPIYSFQNSGKVIYSAGMIRLYKRQGAYYEGAIHEQLRFEHDPPEYVLIDDNICKIFHYGYLKSAYNEKDKYARNIPIIKKEIEKEPNNPFNWYNLGVMEFLNQSHEKALDHFIKSNSLCNGVRYNFHHDLVLRMGECLLILGQYQTCIDFFNTVLKDAEMKMRPDLHYYNGIAYSFVKQYEDAVECFKSCIAIGDVKEGVSEKGIGSFMPLLEWAGILVTQNKVTEAIMKYMEAVFHPNNFAKTGAAELVAVLKKNNMAEVLQELGEHIDLKAIAGVEV